MTIEIDSKDIKAFKEMMEDACAYRFNGFRGSQSELLTSEERSDNEKRFGINFDLLLNIGTQIYKQERN